MFSIMFLIQAAVPRWKHTFRRQRDLGSGSGSVTHQLRGVGQVTWPCSTSVSPSSLGYWEVSVTWCRASHSTWHSKTAQHRGYHHYYQSEIHISGKTDGKFFCRQGFFLLKLSLNRIKERRHSEGEDWSDSSFYVFTLKDESGNHKKQCSEVINEEKWQGRLSDCSRSLS